jgi:hypothetical protein
MGAIDISGIRRIHPFTKLISGPGPPESAPITQIFI